MEEVIQGQEGDQEFSFGHVKIEVSIRNPMEVLARQMEPEFKGENHPGDTGLRVVSMWITYRTTRVNEITK